MKTQDKPKFNWFTLMQAGVLNRYHSLFQSRNENLFAGPIGAIHRQHRWIKTSCSPSVRNFDYTSRKSNKYLESYSIPILLRGPIYSPLNVCVLWCFSWFSIDWMRWSRWRTHIIWNLKCELYALLPPPPGNSSWSFKTCFRRTLISSMENV